MCAVPPKMYRDIGGKSKSSRVIKSILIPGGGLNELYERMRRRKKNKSGKQDREPAKPDKPTKGPKTKPNPSPRV